MADDAFAERILSQGLSAWPEQTALELKDCFEDTVRGRAAFVFLPSKPGHPDWMSYWTVCFRRLREL